MADKTGKDIQIWIDNAAGTLTAITLHVNSETLTGTHSALQNTAFTEDEHAYCYGVASATQTLNGFWNSTTEGIFGPLLGNRTSKTKTIQSYDGIQYLTGEVLPTNIQRSGAVDTVVTFSADLQVTGALTRTSVSVAA
jgi:hypothetical protein